MTDADPDARTDIHELDPQTVERIAAGEVVERPASVVKELVENAVDADASRIDVTVADGGTELVRVADDGVGMTESQVRAAVEQHTTSKIRDIDDLESGVATLGFRGEALHAIGAVSRVTITTRPHGGDRGTELVVEGGEVTSVSPAGCPEGTTVEVRDLFYNVPARRKYLKQPSTEFAHVNTVVTGYALANPDVAVSLTHGDRETFATTGQGDLRETVLSVYGREVAQSMIAVRAGRSPANWESSAEQSAADHSSGPRGGEAASVGTAEPSHGPREDGDEPRDDPNELPDGPLEAVSGLVSHPETNRASRDYLNTFVNGRYVTASSVREAVVEAYDTQLAPDRYPFAVLDLGVDPAAIDVNVHPRKLEVRFADEGGLRRQIEAAVSGALMREGLLRTGAPRGKSAPEQAEISPADVREHASGDAAGTGSPDDRGGGPADGHGESATDEAGGQGREHAPHRTGVPDRHRDDGDATDGRDTSVAPGSPTGGIPEPRSDDPHEAGRKFRGGAEQARFGDADDGDDEGPDLASLPAMRVLGQFRETYVVAETADGLVLVDQHAADERVNYERLRERLRGDVAIQALASPVDLSLTAGEAALAAERAEALAQLGFRTERVDDRTLRVTTVPSLVADAADPELVRDVLVDLAAGREAAAETVEAAADDLLADLACYPSITGNTSLTDGSIRELLAALDDCENPYACPHGRPVLIELDAGDIEARFERDYPGHRG